VKQSILKEFGGPFLGAHRLCAIQLYIPVLFGIYFEV